MSAWLRESTRPLSLETLAYKYGTDKSKDDHKYVDLYHSLFADRRHRVYNLTEIGVATGQSVAMWADYFSSAHIWGFDPTLIPSVLNFFSERSSRVHLFKADAYQRDAPARELLAPESMDIVIDDAWHYPNPAVCEPSTPRRTPPQPTHAHLCAARLHLRAGGR